MLKPKNEHWKKRPDAKEKDIILKKMTGPWTMAKLAFCRGYKKTK